MAIGGLLISAAASAADVQSQAREVLTGHPTTRIAALDPAPAIDGSTNHRTVPAGEQAARVLLGLSPEVERAATPAALRTARAAQPVHHRQLSNSQEMAQKVLLGIGGE
jgi:hypothetical protein